METSPAPTGRLHRSRLEPRGLPRFSSFDYLGRRQVETETGAKTPPPRPSHRGRLIIFCFCLMFVFVVVLLWGFHDGDQALPFSLLKPSNPGGLVMSVWSHVTAAVRVGSFAFRDFWNYLIDFIFSFTQFAPSLQQTLGGGDVLLPNDTQRLPHAHTCAADASWTFMCLFIKLRSAVFSLWQLTLKGLGWIQPSLTAPMRTPPPECGQGSSYATGTTAVSIDKLPRENVFSGERNLNHAPSTFFLPFAARDRCRVSEAPQNEDQRTDQFSSSDGADLLTRGTPRREAEQPPVRGQGFFRATVFFWRWIAGKVFSSESESAEEFSHQRGKVDTRGISSPPHEEGNADQTMLQGPSPPFFTRKSHAERVQQGDGAGGLSPNETAFPPPPPVASEISTTNQDVVAVLPNLTRHFIKIAECMWEELPQHADYKETIGMALSVPVACEGSVEDVMNLSASIQNIRVRCPENRFRIDFDILHPPGDAKGTREMIDRALRNYPFLQRLAACKRHSPENEKMVETPSRVGVDDTREEVSGKSNETTLVQSESKEEEEKKVRESRAADNKIFGATNAMTNWALFDLMHFYFAEFCAFFDEINQTIGTGAGNCCAKIQKHIWASQAQHRNLNAVCRRPPDERFASAAVKVFQQLRSTDDAADADKKHQMEFLAQLLQRTGRDLSTETDEFFENQHVATVTSSITPQRQAREMILLQSSLLVCAFIIFTIILYGVVVTALYLRRVRETSFHRHERDACATTIMQRVLLRSERLLEGLDRRFAALFNGATSTASPSIADTRESTTLLKRLMVAYFEGLEVHYVDLLDAIFMHEHEQLRRQETISNTSRQVCALGCCFWLREAVLLEEQQRLELLLDEAREVTDLRERMWQSVRNGEEKRRTAAGEDATVDAALCRDVGSVDRLKNDYNGEDKGCGVMSFGSSPLSSTTLNENCPENSSGELEEFLRDMLLKENREKHALLLQLQLLRHRLANYTHEAPDNSCVPSSAITAPK